MNVTSTPPLVPTLRRLMRPLPGPRSTARCGLCGGDLLDVHAHVVDLDRRCLVCTCGICALAAQSAGGPSTRYRAVPERSLQLRSIPASDPLWDVIAIPVGLAFFFLNSKLGRYVALYPGPAGATESTLPLDAWPLLAAADPRLSTMEPDVEALLVRRGDDAYACFLVPIDLCYELAGRIRARWTGLTGGDDVRAELDAFFEALRRRSGS